MIGQAPCTLVPGLAWARVLCCTECGIDLLTNPAARVTDVLWLVHDRRPPRLQIACDCGQCYVCRLPLDGPQPWI